MRRDDLIQQLAQVAVHLPPVLPATSALEQVSALCATARLAFGAAAVSVAALRDTTLHYLAAVGEGAEEIVDMDLPVSRGLAGYVAMTGQMLAVDSAADDPRFAHEVAARTGYLPTSLLIVPVRDQRGDVAGVLSVLDRTLASADALVLASSFAAQLGLVLPGIDEVGRMARLLLQAVGDAVAAGDAELGNALRRSLVDLPDVDAELSSVAATLGELRAADAGTRARVSALLIEIVALATPKRRR